MVALKHDADGFLVGDIVEGLDGISDSLGVIAVDVAAIRRILETGDSQLAATIEASVRRLTNASIAGNGIHAANDAVATPNSGIMQKAHSAKPPAEEGKTRPLHDEKGRFSASSGANDRGSGSASFGNDSEGYLKGLAGRVYRAVSDAMPNTEQVDPAIDAIKEVATPLQRGYGILFGGDRGKERTRNRWYQRIWRTLTRNHAEDKAADRSSLKVLKGIEAKPSEGIGFSWLAVLIPVLLGIMKAIFGLPLKISGVLGKGLAGILARMLPAALARRIPIPGGRGRNGGIATVPDIDRDRQKPKARGRLGKILDEGKDKASRALEWGGAKHYGRKAGSAIAGIGRRIGKIRGLGAIGGLLALAGVANTEMDGSLNREQKNQQHGANAGRAAVGTAGAMAGAAIGTMIFPGVGTVIGGIVGGFAADYFAGDASEDIGSRFGSWITNLQFSDIPGMISTKFSEWTQSLLNTEVGQYLKTQWDGLTGGMMQMWNNAVIKFSDAWNGLKSWIDENVTSPISNFLNKVNDEIKRLTGIDVGEVAKKTVKAVKQTTSEAYDGAKSAASSIWKGVKGVASSAWEGTKEAASKTGSYAREKLAEMTGSRQSTVSGLIHWGESKRRGYNDYNRGGKGAASNKENLDLTNMTIGEIMEKQRLPKGHKDRIFAAGKYQIIGSSDPKNDTMGDAVKALNLDKNAKFDEAMQERIFTEYLAKEKRKPIENFITGKSDDVKAAGLSVAKEWASVGTSAKGGKGYYDNDGSNHASIRATEMEQALSDARARYQKLVASGMDKKQAYGIALGAYQEPNAPSGVGTVAGIASTAMGAVNLGKTAYEKGKALLDGAIPESMKQLRVKDAQYDRATGKVIQTTARTKTIGEMGFSRFSDLKGQAFDGGYNDPTALYATSLIQHGLGDNFGEMTAQADVYHAKSAEKSGHNNGNKTDFTLKNIDSGVADARITEIFARQGLQRGVDFQTIDEYKNPSGKATGGHIDFKLNESGQKKIQKILALDRLTQQSIGVTEIVPNSPNSPQAANGATYYDYRQPANKSAIIPSVPPMSSIPKIPDAAAEYSPLTTAAKSQQSVNVTLPEWIVGQDVRDRKIAHIVTGGIAS